MIEIHKKEECCGCELCANICPRQCITMQPDSEGFLYPQINLNECIQCSACEQMCPQRNHKPEYPIIGAYAIQTQDRANLARSASGGGYTSMARKIVSEGGIAVGVAFREGIVCHTLIRHNEELVKQHSGSKYVQSKIGNTYAEIEKILQSEPERKVLFSGTPCQVAALKRYLKKDYPQLYTIDLVCAGVCSPAVFGMYISKMQNKFDKVVDVNFKKKTYGYHSSTMALQFNGGAEYSRSRLTDPMMHVFTAHIADRPACAACSFKGKDRDSDITLFDCWHYTEVTGKKDNDLGHTNVLVHTQKGNDLLFSCGELFEIEEIDADQAISLDGNMVFGQQKHHEKRQLFFEELNQNGLDAAIKKCIPITAMCRLKEFSKKYLYRMGILDQVKKLERR